MDAVRTLETEVRELIRRSGLDPARDQTFNAVARSRGIRGHAVTADQLGPRLLTGTRVEAIEWLWLAHSRVPWNSVIP